MTAQAGDGGPGLSFGMLGPLQVYNAGTSLPLGGRKQRAVLGLLLCAGGHAVSIDRIADSLWGDAPPASFQATVQTYIFHLRSALEPDRPRGTAANVVMTESGRSYRLNVADHSIDALRFEDLVRRGRAALETDEPSTAVELFGRALAVWRGDVLADLAEFGFVLPVAARLNELRLSTLEARIDAELALGHHNAAAAELDRLVVDYPLREHLHAQRMLALYRSDRQSDALAAYRELRTRLHDDLGVEPGRPVQQLHQRVLAQDPSLAWAPPASLSHSPDGFSGNGKARLPEPTREVLSVGTSSTRPRRLVRRLRGMPRRAVAGCAAAAVVAAAGTITLVEMRQAQAGLRALPANSVGELKADGTIAAAIPVGDNPSGLAYGGGALWVADRSDDRVSRIDPASRQIVQVLDVGAAPEALAVANNFVWAANFTDGTITQINMAANRVVNTIAVGAGPSAIASGPGGVWVANTEDNTVQRIDPTSGKADAPIDVGSGPDGLAVDGNTLWVANSRDGTVSEIDITRREPVRDPIPVGTGPQGIVVTGKDVWVTDRLSQSVTRIDRQNFRTAQTPLGDGPGALIATNGAVWVSEEFAGSIGRIDARSGIVTRINVGSSPRGLVAVGHHIWVASGARSDRAHRGGTLTIAAPFIPGKYTGIDPAAAYVSDIQQAERSVYDGLVAFRMAIGADSQVLVPDLAVALPRPSDGGRTYTFTIRRGIKYSTGRVVQASDFRLGIERALLATNAGNPSFYTGIVGARACLTRPEGCDSTLGVVPDDAARRLTIHLTKADPAFLYKLSVLVVPTPPGTPIKGPATAIPGTGPYVIASYVVDKAFVLRRNPRFHEWSFAAQPDGYPDVIRWLITPQNSSPSDDVLAGRADVGQVRSLKTAQATQAMIQKLTTGYPLQLHKQVLSASEWLTVDTRTRPFSSLAARQALSYAVDRNKLDDLLGGPAFQSPTCQLLPPHFPGYSPYCPYTRHPSGGTYRGPNIEKAQALSAASGTRGTPVTITTVTNPVAAAVNSYLVEVLRSLGYQARLHVLPDVPSSYTLYDNPRVHFQLRWLQGWVADYPLPSNFYDNIVACESVEVWYCNRQLDRAATSAAALEGTDPGAALRAWARIDHQVTDLLPVIPINNNSVSYLVSSRVGNFESNQIEGPLLSQLWVR